MGLLSSNPDILGHFNCCSKEISWCTETLHHRWWGWGGKESHNQLLSNKQKMTAIGRLQAQLQPHKRRHSKTKFTASYGRLGSNGLSLILLSTPNTNYRDVLHSIERVSDTTVNSQKINDRIENYGANIVFISK